MSRVARARSASYVRIHGAGDVGWYWHLVEADLRSRGHDVVVMDLPVRRLETYRAEVWPE